jgi:large subunit ribosomal protein L15
MLTLNNLKSPNGANRNTKRIGRGQGSGQGTQAGKGHKGQKARKSGHVRTGFEGNNLPLYMRLPKRGFNNEAFATKYAEVTLAQLELKFENNTTVSKEKLIEVGILSGAKKHLDVKVIGNTALTKTLNFDGISHFSKGAKEIVLSKSGKIN